MSVRHFVYSRDLGAQLWTIFTTKCRCDVSAFDLRRSMPRLSKIDDRCVDFQRSMCRPSKIDVSPFENRCHDVLTFGDGCVDLRRPMIDVSTFEDR